MSVRLKYVPGIDLPGIIDHSDDEATPGPFVPSLQGTSPDRDVKISTGQAHSTTASEVEPDITLGVYQTGLLPLQLSLLGANLSTTKKISTSISPSSGHQI